MPLYRLVEFSYAFQNHNYSSAPWEVTVKTCCLLTLWKKKYSDLTDVIVSVSTAAFFTWRNTCCYLFQMILHHYKPRGQSFAQLVSLYCNHTPKISSFLKKILLLPDSRRSSSPECTKTSCRKEVKPHNDNFLAFLIRAYLWGQLP